MTGAACELLGCKNIPRSSLGRFRGCRRHSQINHPTRHATILSMMGWQPQISNLGKWEEYTQQVLTRETVSATSPPAISKSFTVGN